MITLVDTELRRQAKRFSFRFSCGSCMHYDREARACSHGYPSEPHRNDDLDVLTELAFCKEFELG